MRVNLNESIKEYIDSMRGSYCRAKYILMCVDYIRSNHINLNEYYEGINDDRIKGSNSREKSWNKYTV